MAKIIDEREILVRQPRLGMGMLVTALITMLTVQWMTLDMYLPALPVLKEEFSVSETVLNLSFNSDLLACSIGTLVGGTICDKYGRKPIMIIGLIIAGIPLLVCAFAQGIWTIIIMRGLSGLGGGFAITVGTAIVRDSFEGRSFETITTITQAAAIIGPVFAPAIGSYTIEYLSWRWIFILEGGIIMLTLIPFLFAIETWPKEKRRVDSVIQATVQSFNIIRDIKLLRFLGVVLLITIPMWAYLATCSYVFYDEFGVGNLEYSILYACGTLVSMFAPFIYMFMIRKSNARRVIECTAALIGVAAILFATIGSIGPVLFLVGVIPAFLAEGMVRPLATVVVLNKYHDEAGSASAVIGFALMIVGVLGSAVATLPWSSFILGMAIISAASALLAALLWIRAREFVDM
ncbi:MAG: MFS transporter [Bacillota bacterium]|nr:MFS transporter [Bacillota bacterium]